MSHIYLCSRCLFVGWRGLLLVCICSCSECLVLGEWPKGVCVEISNSCKAWSVLRKLSEVLRWNYNYNKKTHWRVIWYFYTYTLPGVLCIFVKMEKWRTENWWLPQIPDKSRFQILNFIFIPPIFTSTNYQNSFNVVW